MQGTNLFYGKDSIRSNLVMETVSDLHYLHTCHYFQANLSWRGCSHQLKPEELNLEYSILFGISETNKTDKSERSKQRALKSVLITLIYTEAEVWLIIIYASLNITLFLAKKSR